MDLPASLFCPWDFPGKNTGVGCHFLLQGIISTQGPQPASAVHFFFFFFFLPLPHLGSQKVESLPLLCAEGDVVGRRAEEAQQCWLGRRRQGL